MSISRFLPLVPLVFGLAGGLVAQTGQGEEGWMPLFDGKTLEGWKAAENPASFGVEDGRILVHGPRAHLYYVGPVAGALFENFEAEAEIRTETGANSGFYFHTRFQESGWPAHGYEAQVNSTHTDKIRTGSLYGIENVEEAPSKDGEWFTLSVAVRRNHITIKVDGKVLVSWREPEDVAGTRRLSRGTFALQAHDPDSVVSYRSIRVRPLPSWGADLSRAERQLLKPEGPWWDMMDYGPFLSSSVGVSQGDNVILKGITVPLDPELRASICFDTDLLRMVGWEGWLSLEGVTFNGSHGGYPRIRGEPVFVTENEPGWSLDGSFHDPRPIPHGPLPRGRGRYRGLYRHGDRIVLSYMLGGTPVLEMADLERAGDAAVITRSLSLGSRERSLSLSVTVAPQGEVKILPGGHMATVTPAPARLPGAEGHDAVIVVVDRADTWDELCMGAPARGDAAEPSDARRTTTRFASSLAPAHPGAGADNGSLPRLTDGEVAQNHDDTERCTWFDGERARMVLDLGEALDLERINTFSWHRTNRAPQVFVLWGTGHADASPELDLEESGWTRVAEVDTRFVGNGGRHGSCVTNVAGGVGKFRKLLWELTPASAGEGPFITEVDVFQVGDSIPELTEPHHLRRDRRPLTLGLVGAPKGAQFVAQPKGQGERVRVVLQIPPGPDPLALKLAATRGVREPGVDSFAGLTPAADLAPLTRGGPSLFGESVVALARMGEGEGPYVVDDVPVPFENPWGSYLRIGGFDFFADGKRAALCTWNGDVWIVSGLGEKLGPISWKRFATGLFETLGLKIVDDVIYVNGKDQITRLYDLDGDEEADWYECFNNDVYTTANFHEFTFDLQTDPEGYFYFSKAAPVRAGGRGFEKIVPHHGTVMRVSPDGVRLEVYARGMRAPNGIGVSPDGQVTAGDNEGTWVPHCKLHWLKRGSFQGVMDVAVAGESPSTYNRPLCWLPMEVDNSGGGQVWVTSERWGPFHGDLLHLSYGQSSIYKVMKEEVLGQIQGGVFRIPVGLASSAMRGRFSPLDGQLWVCGLKGWQTNAAKLSGFQRVRYTGAPVCMPEELHVTAQGVRIRFTCRLDPELAEDPESYAIKQWNYVWGPQYGSPEVSAKTPDPQILEQALQAELHQHKNHDKVSVSSATLEPDGRTVYLEIPDLAPVMQMRIKLDLESRNGDELRFEIYNTINAVPRPADR